MKLSSDYYPHTRWIWESHGLWERGVSMPWTVLNEAKGRSRRLPLPCTCPTHSNKQAFAFPETYIERPSFLRTREQASEFIYAKHTLKPVPSSGLASIPDARTHARTQSRTPLCPCGALLVAGSQGGKPAWSSRVT